MNTTSIRLACGALAVFLAGPLSAQEESPDRLDTPPGGQPEARATNDHTGTFVGIEDDSFVMRGEGQQETHAHRVAEEVRVTIDGREARLADLEEGDAIRVTLGQDDTLVAVAAHRDTALPNEDEENPAGQPKLAGEREEQPQASAENRDDAVPPARPMLGVVLSPSPTSGVRVDDVLPDSPADEAGIRPADFILSVEGTGVGAPQEITSILAQKGTDEPAAVVLWRSGERRQVMVQATRQLDAGEAARPDLELGDAADNAGTDDQPWLGLGLREVQEGQGAFVASVHPNGPAARSGLVQGNVIVRIDELPIESPTDLIEVVEGLEPGRKIEIVVRDGEAEETLTATLGRRGDFVEAPRFPRGDEGGAADFGDYHPGIPGHAMLLEQHRRHVTQHERIEDLLRELKDEVAALRKQLEERDGAAPPQPVPQQ